MHIRDKHESGFTLIELLVVIAIIGILAAVIFVALDPATRFGEARDAVRHNDVQELLTAIKLYQIDEEGNYPWEDQGQTLTDGTVYMISSDASASFPADCQVDAAGTGACTDATIAAAGDCVDLSLLPGSYVDALPENPDGEATWDASLTGYTLEQNGDILTITSCESEEETGTIDAAR